MMTGGFINKVSRFIIRFQQLLPSISLFQSAYCDGILFFKELLYDHWFAQMSGLPGTEGFAAYSRRRRGDDVYSQAIPDHSEKGFSLHKLKSSKDLGALFLRFPTSAG